MNSALTVKQVADLLAVNERTVYRMANSGELPAFRVAGSWRFLEEDIGNWIEQQKCEAKNKGACEDLGATTNTNEKQGATR